jgi:hypothetical protein
MANKNIANHAQDIKYQHNSDLLFFGDILFWREGRGFVILHLE